MISFYTAVGRYELQVQEDGTKQPVILAGGSEYNISLEEFIVWSSLIWKIHTRDELEQVYQIKQREAHINNDDSFSDTLQRLLQRKLIAEGTDYTGIDALYNLTQNLFISPIKSPIYSKIKAFLHLTLIKKVPFKITKMIFKDEPLDKDETKVLNLVSQAVMSTAEIIKCTEKGVDNIETDDKLIESVYDDDLTTCYNIGIFSRFYSSKTLTLQAIVNLYLKKLVLFETKI